MNMMPTTTDVQVGTPVLNDVPAKPRLRAKSQPMPLHFLVAPEGAPACYGVAKSRTTACVFGACVFHEQCADFVHRLESDKRRGIRNAEPPRYRVICPDDAPMILDLERFYEAVQAGSERRPSTPAEEMLHAVLDSAHSNHEFNLATVAAQACWGGLIPPRAAAEVAYRVLLFFRWLSTQQPYASRSDDGLGATCIWLTGEITRAALRAQGRPHAFRPKLHYEVWNALIGWQLPSEVLRKRRERLDLRYALFAHPIRTPS